MNVLELVLTMALLAGVLAVSAISWLTARILVRNGIRCPDWLTITLIIGSVALVVPSAWLLANELYVAGCLTIAVALGCIGYPIHENTEETLLALE